MAKEALGPVAVGGVGGSGTRLIASMVSSLGYEMGSNLNHSQDDLTFAVLFKRPDLYREVSGLIPEDHPSAVVAARVFESVRGGKHGLGGEIIPMISACLSEPSHDRQRMSLAGRMLRRARRLGRLRRSFRYTEPFEPGLWTWKEPNTLLFVPSLFGVIGGLRYIHVVRNGLSMATSKNKRQLDNWGFLFGVDDEARDLQLRQLVYWARANLAVSDYLSAQPRSLVVSHERLVLEPVTVAEGISSFLGRPCTEKTHEFIKTIRRPEDFERTYDPNVGGPTDSESEDVRRALNTFGYDAPHG